MEKQTYIGTKIVRAKPMTRKEYNDFRGWVVPENENPNDDGYLVEYTDSAVQPELIGKAGGYVSWSPKDVFERSYHKYCDRGTFDFGAALHLLKSGQKVARAGWNGANQFVYYVPENKYPASQNANSPVAGMFKDDLMPYRAYLALKTAQGDVATWVPSISDVLATDWTIIE